MEFALLVWWLFLWLWCIQMFFSLSGKSPYKWRQELMWWTSSFLSATLQDKTRKRKQYWKLLIWWIGSRLILPCEHFFILSKIILQLTSKILVVRHVAALVWRMDTWHGISKGPGVLQVWGSVLPHGAVHRLTRTHQTDKRKILQSAGSADLERWNDEAPSLLVSWWGSVLAHRIVLNSVWMNVRKQGFPQENI